MKIKLRSILCVALAMMLVLGAMPAMAAKAPAPTITEFTVFCEDVGTGVVIGTDAAGIKAGLTSHKVNLHIYLPGGTQVANSVMKYASSNKKVASITAKGVITLKTPGTTEITVTPKSNKAAAKKISVTVVSNSASYTNPFTEAEKQALLNEGKWGYAPKSLAIKGGKVVVEFYVFNGWTKPLKGGTKKTNLAYWPNYENADKYQIITGTAFKFKGAIKKGKEGVATITLTKAQLDPTKVDLRKAYADFEFITKSAKGTDTFDMDMMAALKSAR